MKRIAGLSFCVIAGICGLTAESWSASGDPRVGSESGDRIGVGTDVLVDSGSRVWSLPADEYAHLDGSLTDGGYNTIALLYHDDRIYRENSSDEWYVWNGSAWTRVSGDPTKHAAGGASADGAHIGVGTDSLVDSVGNLWTLPADEYANRNGARVAGNSNTVQILYHNAVIYTEDTTGGWRSWSGSSWIPAPANPLGPNLVQYRGYNSPVCPANAPGCTPAFVGNSSVKFATATTRGNAIWVAATVSDYGGIHTITVTDSQNNTYHELNQGNDGTPGSQSVAHFYAGNIQGGADTVTVNWSADNYKGVIAAEIAGVTASPLVGNTVEIQDGNLASGSDNVGLNDINVTKAATPSLLVALTMDTDGGGSDTGGTGFCAIPHGVGFTQVARLWNWAASGQPACNLATVETKQVTGSGDVAGTFTSTHLSDPYVTAIANSRSGPEEQFRRRRGRIAA
jgi:hypothetical protein